MQNQITTDIEKFKVFVKTLIEKFRSSFSKKQNPTVEVGAKESVLSPAQTGASRNTRILIIAGVIFTLTVIFLVVGLIASRIKMGTSETSKNVAPSTVSTAIPESSVSNPSRYATDEAVLKTETDLKKLDSDLNSIDLRESILRPPALDFDVKFD